MLQEKHFTNRKKFGDTEESFCSRVRAVKKFTRKAADKVNDIVVHKILSVVECVSVCS